MTAHAIPVLFGDPERSLFGWVHQPEGRRARAAVVLCSPLARECFSVHDTYRVVAESLAGEGITAIRFDYDGTGDSAGGDGDPDRIKAYLASIRHAVELARDLGAENVALLGMRMGALLASLAAQDFEQVPALVLWDPCPSGRDFLRRQTALFQMQFGTTSPAGGGIEIPGFVVTEQTAADMKALTAPTSLPQVERALVLTRPDRPSDATYGLDLERTQFEPALGQPELMDVEPYLNKIPPTAGRIVEWLSDVLRGDTTVQKEPETRSVMTVTNQAGLSVTEQFVRLGPNNLFGIMTGDAEAAGPVLMMLNSGIDSHIGPNRMWVELSREWAGLGLRCVRFDLSGLGDSPVRPGQTPFVVRAPEAFDDVVDVAATFAETGTEAAPVVLVGLCSGAYQALESAIDLLPRAVLAVNPILHFQAPETISGPMDPRRRLYRQAGNLRSAYRALPDWRIIKVARSAYLALARMKSTDNSATSWLQRTSDKGTDILCLCGEEEAESFFQGALPASDRFEMSEHSRLQIVKDLDHALIPAADRATAIRILTDQLAALGFLDASSGIRHDNSSTVPSE